jgi:hypothetical protein
VRDCLDLIDNQARDRCVALLYHRMDMAKYVDDTRFWKFGQFNCELSVYHGVSVFECFGKVTGLPWSQLCDTVIQQDENAFARGILCY